MASESGESLDQYLLRLSRARGALIAKIERPQIVYPLESELVTGRSLASRHYSWMVRELRAIEATKWFRLRASVIDAKNRLLRVIGRQPRLGPLDESAFPVNSASEDWFDDYEKWVDEIDEVREGEEPFIEVAVESMKSKPLLGLILVLRSDDVPAFERFAASLARQFYQHYWVTVCAVGGLTDSELGQLRHGVGAQGEVLATNDFIDDATALNMALSRQKGAWILCLRPSDILPPQALYVFADAINEHPNSQLIYSDEDHLSEEGRRCHPHFKPDWNELLLLGNNYLGSAVCVRVSRLQELGGFRAGFEGVEMWDMFLRFTEGLAPDEVVHVPFLLLNRSGLDGAADTQEAGVHAVQEAIVRRGLDGTVAPWSNGSCLKLRFRGTACPMVSIIIPTKDHVDVLRTCVESIEKFTAYPSFEFIIVDNGSSELAAKKYLAELESRPNVTVLHEPGPFNYATLNNKGAYYARGEILALLNNDIQVLDPDWMTHLVTYALQPNIGAVGPLLLFPDSSIQHAGVVVGLSNVFAIHVFTGIRDCHRSYQHRAVLDQWICAVTGACMFMRKSLFEEVGGLDSDSFPVVYNDIDLCLKARLAGYQNVYAGSVTCIHHEAKSRGLNDTPEKKRAELRTGAFAAERWGAGYSDPYYHPNFQLSVPGYVLSYSPRVHKRWYR